MTESVDSPAITTKELGEINPKGLADSLALALSEQVGGKFKVSLIKLEQTHSGCGDNKLVLHFDVRDDDPVLRMIKLSHKRRDGGIANDVDANGVDDVTTL